MQLAPHTLFLHIPKTAGTTTRSILESRYTVDQIYRVEDIASEIERRRRYGFPSRVRFASGHVPAFFEKFFSSPPNLVTVLRDPLERISSTYRFWRSLDPNAIKDPKIRDLVSLAHKLSFESFLLSNDPRLCGETENYQVRLLGQTVEEADLDFAVLLKNAKAVIERCVWFGLAEKMPESLQWLSYAFGQPPEPASVRLNATPVKSTAGKIPPAAAEAARERNRLDYELYEYASRLQAERIQEFVSKGTSWKQVLEQNKPAHLVARPHIFSMRMGQIGSGWWSREFGSEDAEFVWRFALRGQNATLHFWWPIRGSSVLAIWLPFIQKDVAWESIRFALNGVELAAQYMHYPLGRLAVARVSAELVQQDQVSELSLSLAAPALSKADDAYGKFGHDTQTAFAVSELRWFEPPSDGQMLPEGLLRHLEEAWNAYCARQEKRFQTCAVYAKSLEANRQSMETELDKFRKLSQRKAGR